MGKRLDELHKHLHELACEKARQSFYAFVQLISDVVLPEGFQDGEHIREICAKLQLVEEGKIRRLMLFLPPRSSKSTLSQMFQAWCFGRKPTRQLMGVSYAMSLADSTSRTVRNLVASPEFKQVFPGLGISPDTRASNRWKTLQGGIYNAAGITSGIAGKGAHIAVVDDPLSEQDAMSKTQRDFVKKWYPGGLRTRLMPGGAIIIITTRWHEDDLAGWLLSEADKSDRADQWDVVEFPAIWTDDEGNEFSYWPEWKPLEELQQIRDDPTFPASQWNALYQQHPTPEEGSLIMRDYFSWWKETVPLPECHTIMMSMDTAFSEKTRADFSVLQVWGLFNAGETDSRGREHNFPNALLLSNRRGRWAYPELLKNVRELVKKFNPDRILIENKASGQVLIPDLMAAGLPVVPFTPGKGQDKEARVQAVLRFFVAGRIWVQEGKDFAVDLVEESVSFPFARNDDQVDAMTLALLYLRDFNSLYMEQAEEEEIPRKRRKSYYGHRSAKP